jgi:nucleoid DNA-binding protein
VGDKQKRKSKQYKQLLKMTAQSSGYYEYEVEDVVRHLIGNIQVLLAEGTDVKLRGIGTMKVKKMRISRMFSTEGEKMRYTAYRVSVTSDSLLQQHLKEHYYDSEPTE